MTLESISVHLFSIAIPHRNASGDDALHQPPVGQHEGLMAQSSLLGQADEVQSLFGLSHRDFSIH